MSTVVRGNNIPSQPAGVVVAKSNYPQPIKTGRFFKILILSRPIKTVSHLNLIENLISNLKKASKELEGPFFKNYGA